MVSLLKYLLPAALFLVLGAMADSEEDFVWYSKAYSDYFACDQVVSESATFCDASDSTCSSCTNPYSMASVVGCMYDGKPPSGSFSQVALYCNSYYAANMTNETWWSAYETYIKDAVNISADPDFNSTEIIEYPIILDASVIDPAIKGYKQFLDNYNYSLYYGSGMLAYWGLVLVLSGIFHWSKFLFPGFMKWCTGPISTFWRANVTIPATLGKRKNEEKTYLKIIQFLIPSRLESIVVFGFILVTTFCNAHGIYFFNGNPIIDTKEAAMLRYCADRTGIISVIIMPLLILFAGRNNFLLWITGLNYATFITYHRWISRVTLVLVIIHSAVYTKDLIYYDELAEDYKDTYLIWGCVATVAGGIIWIQSFLYLRRNWYELFLLGHIIFAVLFIVGTWIHVVDLGYVWFLYPCVAVWCLDRAVRIARLIHFGFPKAEVSLLANETLRVVVRRPKLWPATPGGHAFVHFIRPTCFWQSHPFTFTSTVDAENIVLYCKVKGGITHSLYRFLTTHPGQSAQIRVSLEGPYGEPTAARVSDTAVFIAGGNGIPGIYSEAVDLAKRADSTSKKSLKLHWLIKDYGSLLWFYDEILALKNTNIQCTIHVTRPTLKVNMTEKEVLDKDLRAPDSSNKSDENEKESSHKFTFNEIVDVELIHRIRAELPHVAFSEGRPSIEALVKSEIEESAGSVAFVTCGHPVMVDEVRYCCAHSLYDAKGKRIDFYEQLQVWA